MKRVYIFIATALFAFLLSGCDASRTSEGGEVVEHFQILFNPDLTRTAAANDGTVSWVVGDKLEVLHKIASGTSFTKDGSFSIKNVTTGLSESDGVVNLDASASYQWFAFYPYGSSIVSPASVSLSIPAQQTQNGGGSLAHLAGSGAPLFGTGSSIGTAVPTIQMHQVASGVKVTVANNSGKTISVSKLTFAVAGAALAGTFNADLSGTTPALTANSAVAEVVLNLGSPVSIASGSSALFSMLLAPCTVSGDILITVETSNGLSQTFTKSVSGLAFESGKLNDTSVSFTETPVEVPGKEPASYGAVPTDAQVAWQRQELIMFYHFGPATFSGYDGDRATYSASELISQFQPSAVNADQWVSVAAENGFKEVILTAKHHDGFCLWDNPESTCDIAACPSPYNVDVVKAVSDAAKAKGINFGIYMSPWDKVNGNDANYASKFISAIHSVADGAYGTISEFWLDGHNASSLNFNSVNAAIRDKNPDCVIFSNVGPGCRWVGNEDGVAGATNWSTFTPSAHSASQSSLPGSYGTYLAQGDQGGSYWIPAECDLSIRPIGDNNGWFWGAGETPKTAKQLLSVYYNSVGRNSVMLLNVPPTTGGVLDAADVTVLETFHSYLTNIFGTNLISGATVDEELTTEARGYDYKAEYAFDENENSYWAVSGDNTISATLVLELNGTKRFNVISLQEFIKKGQRVTNFSVEYYDGSWKSFANGTTVGAKRLVKGSTVNASKIRVKFNSLACPLISEIGLFMDDVR